MDADGTNIRRVTTASTNDFTPCWYPDGTRLAYQGSVAGVDQVFVINLDGTGAQPLTSAGANVSPALRAR